MRHVACHVLTSHVGLYTSLQVYKTSLWLMLFGSKSPKRLHLRSTWAHIHGMDLGRLANEVRTRCTRVKTSRADLVSMSVRKLVCYLHVNMCFNGHLGRKGKAWTGLPALKETQPETQSLTLCAQTRHIMWHVGCRQYPPAFGRRLLRLWAEEAPQDRGSLRLALYFHACCCGMCLNVCINVPCACEAQE